MKKYPRVSSLTFCIPAYNDAGTLLSLIQKCQKVGEVVSVPFFIHVINDGSTDHTGAILLKLVQSEKNIIVTTHDLNHGYGVTIRQLYESATTQWLFSVPGDYQIDPSQLLTLLSHTDHVDIIIGDRRIRRDPQIKKFLSNTYTLLLRLFYRLPYNDVDSVKLIRTDVFKKIHLSYSSAFVDAELLIRAKRAGIPIVETPIEHLPRKFGVGGGARLQTVLPTIIDMLKFRFGI